MRLPSGGNDCLTKQDRPIPCTRSEFLRRFGKTTPSTLPGQKKEHEFKQKLFRPDENLTSRRDVAERQVNLLFGNNNMTDEAKERQIAFFIDIIGDAFKNPDDNRQILYNIFWPRQLIQLLGRKKYEELYDHFGIGTKNINGNYIAVDPLLCML